MINVELLNKLLGDEYQTSEIRLPDNFLHKCLYVYKDSALIGIIYYKETHAEFIKLKSCSALILSYDDPEYRDKLYKFMNQKVE